MPNIIETTLDELCEFRKIIERSFSIEIDVADLQKNQQEKSTSNIDSVRKFHDALRSFLIDAIHLKECLKLAKNEEQRVLAFAELCRVSYEFIWDYGDSFPNTLRQKIKLDLNSYYSSQKKLFLLKYSFFSDFIEKIRLFLPSLISGKNLFEIRRKALTSVLSSLSELVEEDSNEVTQQSLDALKDEISSIQNVTVRESLEGELQRVSAFSDLASLRETVYLFRSPRNAERLLLAIEEADSETVEPKSLSQFQRELGLGEEEQGQ